MGQMKYKISKLEDKNRKIVVKFLVNKEIYIISGVICVVKISKIRENSFRDQNDKSKLFFENGNK